MENTADWLRDKVDIARSRLQVIDEADYATYAFALDGVFFVVTFDEFEDNDEASVVYVEHARWSDKSVPLRNMLDEPRRKLLLLTLRDLLFWTEVCKAPVVDRNTGECYYAFPSTRDTVRRDLTRLGVSKRQRKNNGLPVKTAQGTTSTPLSSSTWTAIAPGTRPMSWAAVAVSAPPPPLPAPPRLPAPSASSGKSFEERWAENHAPITRAEEEEAKYRD
jgi:hypothetical protein